ncbi:MAG: hypothetical protein D6687_05950 [Acidobacteria bacterium]|jgi:hypothetical protein|nr:MAG: hypothetical protein D6687_05950 [Acidobacteriota bacterium]GIU82659.1 MAG: hypothetical protein KatS3mg006_1723 [Pyrinomonadaceae bacterium]
MNVATKSLIIHINIGNQKRTEFFDEDRIRLGTETDCELQVRTSRVKKLGLWFEIRRKGEDYYITKFDESLDLLLNGKSLKSLVTANEAEWVAIKDGDRISIDGTGVNFSFFIVEPDSALVKVNRFANVAPFIEEAALEAATSSKREDAKIFLRELAKELFRETSLKTKLIISVLFIFAISSLLYFGFSFISEIRKTREQVAKQEEIIQRLEKQIQETNEQLSNLDKTSQQIIKTVSLAPNLRVQYGDGVCLIVGTYDLVSKQNGKVLRYPDPSIYQPDPFEPLEGEGIKPKQYPNQVTLTTEGNGMPVEYDFIGTGFHVGNGYIVTNRHVVHPWEEDDLVIQMMKQADAKARVKKLVAYFPKLPNPIALKVVALGKREDIAIGVIDPLLATSEIPALPIDNSSDAVAIGKMVVSIGYPNGPDRLLAMLDDEEARSISARFGNSRQALLNYLAQAGKIQPLTTPGAITDLDSKRIVHDAKTAEGGSGAPLFGQSGKVIGVNFGVFTENTATNMAIPIKFAVELLKEAGWKSPEEIQNDQAKQTQAAQTLPK